VLDVGGAAAGAPGEHAASSEPSLTGRIAIGKIAIRPPPSVSMASPARIVRLPGCRRGCWR
jgi:hypothetical protein